MLLVKQMGSSALVELELVVLVVHWWTGNASSGAFGGGAAVLSGLSASLPKWTATLHNLTC